MCDLQFKVQIVIISKSKLTQWHRCWILLTWNQCNGISYWCRNNSRRTVTRFGHKVGQIGPMGQIRDFLDQIQYILDRFRWDSVHFDSAISSSGFTWPNKVTRSQNVLNLIWKIPGFVPFGANLTHFGAKLYIPGGQ